MCLVEAERIKEFEKGMEVNYERSFEGTQPSERCFFKESQAPIKSAPQVILSAAYYGP